MRHLRFVPQSQPVLALRAARPGRAERAARVPGAGEKIPVLSFFAFLRAYGGACAPRGARATRETRDLRAREPLAPRPASLGLTHL